MLHRGVNGTYWMNDPTQSPRTLLDNTLDACRRALCAWSSCAELTLRANAWRSTKQQSEHGRRSSCRRQATLSYRRSELISVLAIVVILSVAVNSTRRSDAGRNAWLKSKGELFDEKGSADAEASSARLA